MLFLFIYLSSIISRYYKTIKNFISFFLHFLLINVIKTCLVWGNKKWELTCKLSHLFSYLDNLNDNKNIIKNDSNRNEILLINEISTIFYRRYFYFLNVRNEIKHLNITILSLYSIKCVWLFMVYFYLLRNIIFLKYYHLAYINSKDIHLKWKYKNYFKVCVRVFLSIFSSFTFPLLTNIKIEQNNFTCLDAFKYKN